MICVPRRSLAGDKKQDLSRAVVVVNSICNVIKNILCYMTEKQKWLRCREEGSQWKQNFISAVMMMITMNWK